jgi:negative regulator of genetic competence, sporulation and motility
MRRIYAVLTLAIPFTALLGGCAGERDEQEQRLAAMQTEIEQLTNAFGRLEFRVTQLEDQLVAGATNSSTEPTMNSDSSSTTQDVAEAASPQSDKRYDLAPVE